MVERHEEKERPRSIELPENASAEHWLVRLGERVESYSSFRTPFGSTSGGGGGSWKKCSHHSCLGEALPSGVCLTHTNLEERRRHFEAVARDRKPLSLNALTISQSLWDEVVSSPIFVDGVPTVRITFIAAEINATIKLSERRLRHSLDFTSARIFSHLEFRNCIFEGTLNARFSYFRNGSLSCFQSEFLSDLDISFLETTNTSCDLRECRFQRRFVADGCSGAIDLTKSIFELSASFRHCKGHVIVNDVTFRGLFDVAYSKFEGFTATHTRVESAHHFGPCKSTHINLQSSTFLTRVHIDVECERANLSGALFESGGLIEARTKAVDLSRTMSGGPLRVIGKTAGTHLPQIVSLINSDAGQMSFSNVDLTKCSFYGAHGLDTVDIESTVRFARSPWWAGRRRYIADEYSWRAGAGFVHSYGWKISGIHIGAKLPELPKGTPEPVLREPLTAAQVASMYRKLRRSLESKSDMPGAADFYYGEMEMRRFSAPPTERVLLSAYRFAAGYGMRAWRAFASWALLIAISTNLMKLTGFEDGAYSISRAVLFAIRASLPGISTLEKLTQLGQAVEVFLRVLGPVALALFLIALRGKLVRKPSD